MARVLLPEVMAECVFGMDRDPVAVDLARAALWAEMGGEQSISCMDRNVVCVNSLSGPYAQPPKLAERLGDPSVVPVEPAPATLTTGPAREKDTH